MSVAELLFATVWMLGGLGLLLMVVLVGHVVCQIVGEFAQTVLLKLKGEE